LHARWGVRQTHVDCRKIVVIGCQSQSGEALRIAQSWIAARSQIDAAVEGSRPLIADSVSRTQDGFIFTKPRQGPAEPHCGPEVVPVVLVPWRLRVRRVFAGELDRGHRTFRDSRLPHIPKTGSGDSKQSCGSSNRQNLRAVFLPGHAVVVVAHSEVQRQVRTNLPVIFEERPEFVLMVVLHTHRNREYLIGWALNVVGLAYVAYGTGEFQ